MPNTGGIDREKSIRLFEDRISAIDREMAEMFVDSDIRTIRSLSEAVSAPPFKNYPNVHMERNTLEKLAEDLVDLDDDVLLADLSLMLGEKLTAREVPGAELIVVEESEEIKPEKVNDLTQIAGIGRSKAEALYDAGYHWQQEVALVGQQELSQVNGIGNALAARMKADVGDMEREDYGTPHQDLLWEEPDEGEEPNEVQAQLLAALEQEYGDVGSGLQRLSRDDTLTIVARLRERGLLDAGVFCKIVDQTVPTITVNISEELSGIDVDRVGLEDNTRDSDVTECPVDGCSVLVSVDSVYDHCLDEHGFYEESMLEEVEAEVGGV